MRITEEYSYCSVYKINALGFESEESKILCLLLAEGIQQ